MLEAVWNLFTSTFAWGFVAGLVVGWNLIPQPAWVSRMIEKYKG